MGRGNNKAEQMVLALSSGNGCGVTSYFDFGALSQLRDALKFLLGEGEACSGPVPSEESYVSAYSVSALNYQPQRFPFLLCVFVGA